jgi:hypothetical protein
MVFDLHSHIFGLHPRKVSLEHERLGGFEKIY